RRVSATFAPCSSRRHASQQRRPLLRSQEGRLERRLLHAAEVSGGEADLLFRYPVLVGEVDAADAWVVGVQGDGEAPPEEGGGGGRGRSGRCWCGGCSSGRPPGGCGARPKGP